MKKNHAKVDSKTGIVQPNFKLFVKESYKMKFSL